MIQEADQVIGQGRDVQLVRVSQRTRPAMSTGVEPQQANSRSRAIDRERLVQVAAEAMLEDEGKPLPLVAVMESQAIAIKEGHTLNTSSIRFQDLSQEDDHLGSTCRSLQPVHDEAPRETRI